MELCSGFLETSNTTFRCDLPAGHYEATTYYHEGPGAARNTWAIGPAPRARWTDNTPGATGCFRKPDDSSGRTPFDGHDPIPRDGGG